MSQKEKAQEDTRRTSAALDAAEESMAGALVPGVGDGFSLEKAKEMRDAVMKEIEDKIAIAIQSVHQDTAHAYSIKTKVELIERAKIMLDKYISGVLVLDGTPRAYEVFATLIKNISEMAERVIKLEQNKTLEGGPEKHEPPDPSKPAELPPMSTQDVVDRLIEGRYSDPVDVSTVSVATDDDKPFAPEE